MYHGASVSAICSIVLSLQGVPYSKSHAISLKHPGQALRHPLTNTEVRHPGPFAMSHLLSCRSPHAFLCALFAHYDAPPIAIAIAMQSVAFASTRRVVRLTLSDVSPLAMRHSWRLMTGTG